MSMTENGISTELKLKLELHAKWLRDEEGGERLDLSGQDLSGANLQGADLGRADLQGVNLSGADLRGANLDFSSWPLWCGSFDAKADKQLFAQLLKHVVMLDVSWCDEETRAAMTVLRKMPCASWFDSYRNDIGKTPETDEE